MKYLYSMLPKKLKEKLNRRSAENALRALPSSSRGIDFSSNDYLGFSKDLAFAKVISARAAAILEEHNIAANGATGSRLLSGNHILYRLAEGMVSRFHESERALIFNSGYDANIGFFQSVPQRGDLIIYDEFIHASIRDGLTMSNARAYKFKHNNVADLKKVITRLREMHHLDDQGSATEVYVVTESVFSMDGDTPDLKAIAEACRDHSCHLVVDEAHATGVIGKKGQGLVQELGLSQEIFARIVTFGKGVGAHGAAILGGQELTDYLTNYARSLIYTTALPPHSLATIIAAYEQLAQSEAKQPLGVKNLQTLITHFNHQLKTQQLDSLFIPSNSAIHCAIIPGNDRVKKLSSTLKNSGFDVKPILSPTVAKGEERLRFCLHAFNSLEEIKSVLSLMSRSLTHEVYS